MSKNGRTALARRTSVSYLLKGSVALSILVAVTACQAAVMKDKVEPEPTEPAFSFVGTWRYEAPRWEMLEDGEDYVMVGAAVRTLTFTESRWILHIVTIPNDLAPADLDLADETRSGTWGSVTGSTITKTFLDWNDEEDRPNDDPTNMILKYHIVSGDVVLMQHWHEYEPDERYAKMERVKSPEADLVGRWVQEFENEDEAWTREITLGADGSFRRLFTGHSPPSRHDVTGTYELDSDEKFIFVTITETLNNGELATGPFWAPGELLRFAYAPSNNRNLIVMSLPWREQLYDLDLGMKVDRPEVPYGDYFARPTKVE